MMIQKVISKVLSGLKGIICSKNLNTYQKIILFCDNFRFLFLLIFVYFFKKKIHIVQIKSFNYTVYFDNFISFYFTFNDIFCAQLYVPIKISNYFDLGANIGLSVLWYKFFNPNLSVSAFEPDKNSFAYLLKNIKANNLKDIHTHKIALSNKKGISKFYAIIDDLQNLDSGLTLNLNLPYKSYMVKTDILSKYIQTTIDLVKIDIEGAEYDVFDDLFKTHKIKLIKSLIIEFHFFNNIQKEMMKKKIHKLNKIGKVELLEECSMTNVFLFIPYKYIRDVLLI